MAALRIAIHGLALLLANLVGIAIAFMLRSLVRPSDQLMLQVAVAAVLSVGLFIAWTQALRVLRMRGLIIRTRLDAAFAYLAALAWNPIVFVPTHYLTQGYLTAPSNIYVLMGFQIPVNALSMILAHGLSSMETRESRFTKTERTEGP